MKYFLDSAKMNEIKYAYEKLGIDGVTTNPKHIKLSGKPFLTVINEMAEWVRGEGIEGYEKFPISVEINPHLDNAEEMYSEGKKIASLSPNFVIKIPSTEEGLIASRRLEAEGIRTNVTLVFTSVQAIMPAKGGALFCSPFVGWKEQFGKQGTDYIKDIVQIYKNYDYKTEIIVAALRNPTQIAQAALAGADIVTCGLAVYKDSFQSPFTNYGLGVFTEAWDETAQ